MEPEVSLPCSQEPATGLYAEFPVTKAWRRTELRMEETVPTYDG
jgi:hypothetical protein